MCKNKLTDLSLRSSILKIPNWLHSRAVGKIIKAVVEIPVIMSLLPQKKEVARNSNVLARIR